MALIKCSECGKQVSDLAETCPHCGASNKAYTYCSYCGAKSVNDNFCTNCGRSMNGVNNYQYTTTNQNATNSVALAGGITGICSCFIDPFGLAAVTAIILSSIGLSQVKATGARGKGWAITGLVCGIVEAILKFIWMVSYFG